MDNLAFKKHPELFGSEHVDFQFTPNVDFHCEELLSNYLVGYRYTVREDCVILKELVIDWINEGKVRVLTDTTPIALVSGEGE